MTNEERIYKLCEYVMDLIYELQYSNGKCDESFDWIVDEIKSIRQDIDNN